MYSYVINCYTPTDLKSSVNTYWCLTLDEVLKEIKNIFKPKTGISEITICAIQLINNIPHLIRKERLYSLQEAKDLIKLWLTFS